MLKSDPLTALAYMEKEIDALNKEGAARYGKKWKDFVLTDAEKALFDGIEPGDKAAIKAAYDKVGARIEKEYPVSTWEKVLEFRRVAMLFNSRTIMRNTLANPPTALLRYVSDRIEGVGQYVAHLIDPDFEVTQSVRGSNTETRKAAIQVYKSEKVQNLLKEVPGRLSEVPQVGKYAKTKQVFKGGIVSKFINKMTGNGIEKLNAKMGKENAGSVLELGRNAAYGALEITDSPMVRENFISRLGSYMRAKGITNPDDVPDVAIDIALEEALKATYKDNSWLVQAIRKGKGAVETAGNSMVPGLGDAASQALVPYVQAPGNIGARIIDYSALGGSKGIAKIITGASTGNRKLLTKGIEEASKGLTGSLAAALGVALYRSGVITGTYSDDKDQKAFEKQNGFREFAIKWKSPVDGKVKYDTIDWAQPAIDTIMGGVLLAQAIENSDEYDSDVLRYFGIEGSKAGKAIGVAKKAAGKEINYFFNATPLKNLGELFKGKANGEQDIAANLWENTVEDFASALVPAGVNAVAKSVDPIQRQTYDPDNSFATFLNTNAAKIPKVTEKLPVKYNTWGEPLKYGDTKGDAAIAKLLYPGEHTTDTSDEVSKEINRIFDETQNKAVFPQVAPYKVDGVALTAQEVSKYQETMGKRNRELTEALMNTDGYKDIDDKTKSEILEKMYGMSNAIAANEIKDKEISKTYSSLAETYRQQGAQAVVNSLVGNTELNNAGLSSSTNAAKEIQQEYAKGNIEKAQQMTEQALSDYDAAKAAGYTDSDGNVRLQDYRDLIDSAGKGNEKMRTDLPKLKELGADHAAYHVYANAVQEIPNVTPTEFVTTYNAINTDKSNKLTQKEMTDYLNSHFTGADVEKATQIFNAYNDGSWVNKKGVKKKVKWNGSAYEMYY